MSEGTRKDYRIEDDRNGCATAPTPKTALEEINQRLADACVRLNGVNGRASGVVERATGKSQGGQLVAMKEKPAPSSSMDKIMVLLELLDERIDEADQIAADLNRIA